MFPSYYISTSTEITSGAGTITYTLVATSSPFRVVAVRMQQEKDLSETFLTCGSTIIAHNYAKDYPLDLVNFECNSNLILHKSGTDEAFVSVTYYPLSYVPAQPLPATNTAQYINGFSYGEVITGFFLLLIVVGLFFGGIMNRIIGVKQKPNYRFIVKL